MRGALASIFFMLAVTGCGVMGGTSISHGSLRKDGNWYYVPVTVKNKGSETATEYVFCTIKWKRSSDQKVSGRFVLRGGEVETKRFYLNNPYGTTSEVEDVICT